jgi:hypothetical protein
MAINGEKAEGQSTCFENDFPDFCNNFLFGRGIKNEI